MDIKIEALAQAHKSLPWGMSLFLYYCPSF